MNKEALTPKKLPVSSFDHKGKKPWDKGLTGQQREEMGEMESFLTVMN
jgi:hypothetical protein